MASRLAICYFILVVWLNLAHFGVLGSRSLSTKQGLPPQKHTIKTIKSEYGDIYDCVDFYKQPAFNHPWLKNHSFHLEMKPPSIPNEITKNDDKIAMDSIKLKGGGCPKGTVPIRRMGKLDDNILVSQLHVVKSVNDPEGYLDRPGVYFAIAQSKNDPDIVYNGVAAYVTNYNPKIAEQPQYSSAEIVIKNGADSIIAGWTVNPSAYKDNRTRFFAFATVNGHPCFNTKCGFVTYSHDVPIDFVVQPISERGRSGYVTQVAVYKDLTNGVWWLTGNRRPIGFWPDHLFTSLGGPGSYAACGGEVYYPQKHPGSIGPEMGSGFFPKDPLINNAFCSWFHVLNDKGEAIEIHDTEEFANKPDSYKVVDNDDGNPLYGHHVLFGGPFYP